MSEASTGNPRTADVFELTRQGKEVARLTGLEPATPGVTGRYSNQLSYNRASACPTLAPDVDCF